MTKTYFVNKYDEIFKELFKKKDDWTKIEKVEDISGIIDFCYDIENYEVESKLKVLSVDKFSEFKNKAKVNFEYNKIVNIYVLLISENEIYIYKEGKVETDKVIYYSEQNYFNYTFEQIKYDVFKVLNPLLEENKLENNGFKILGMKYGVDKDYKVNLLEIDIDPDLSIEIDKSHKMKLHYWIFFDILNLFVLKNKQHHRWCKCEENMKIQENNIEENINRPKKYLINRSHILKNILNKNGWVEGKINEEVDFSYWDVYDAKGVTVKSNVRTIARNITSVMDNKKSMYETLKKNNLTDFLPKTYTDMRNIDKNIFTNDKIYFLKEAGGSGGKAVTAINSYEQMTGIISKKPAQYILQEEVPNMYLDNGHKTTMRIFVLITDNKNIYTYKEGRVFIYKDKYTKNNLENDIHNCVYNSSYHNLSSKDYYEKVFNQIEEINYLTTNLFIKDKIISNGYQILGYDYIIDNNYKVYLIEINAYPNLQPYTEIHRILNTRMITDFVNLYVKPKFDDVEPQLGEWELCN